MLDEFRLEARVWLEQNCPASMRQKQKAGDALDGSTKKRSANPDAYVWLERMVSRGWTAPTWPKEYGGAGLDKQHFVVLLQELQRINARPPLGGMGLSMLGPTLLEYGTEEQKRRHLPPIVRGELSWCQGYSEPGAGSDLASLSTRAEDKGDYYLVNGSKIWTSGANFADWIFCLVRTNPAAAKHEGISFLMFSMDSPGITVKPINLINGHSPFCQTFFDDVRVPKTDLVHKENQGWVVAKRLLQHERSGLEALAAGDISGPLERIKPSVSLAQLAMKYTRSSGIVDRVLRDEIVINEMQKQAFFLTQRRIVAESEAKTPGAATSIMNYIEAEYVKAQLELQTRIRGTQSFGWEGDEFTSEELAMNRLNYEAKAISIAGGSNEIQLNIIAKRVLGLPD